jgi:hypothetical protein
MTEATAAPKPSTTLQFLILYPSLVLALVGSIPTIVQHFKAWRLDSQVNRVQIVEEQQKLWERNLECLVDQKSYEVSGPDRITVRVSLCPKTADVLVRYHLNDWVPTFRWVAKPVLRRE